MTRPLKAGALALGIVGLLVIVAMAARGGHPSTTGHVSTRPVPNTLQDSFITLLAIAYVAVMIAIVAAVFHFRGRWHDPKSPWLKNFALVTILMFGATAFGYYVLRHSHFGHKAAQATRQQGNPNSQNGTGGLVQPLPARETQFQWPLALGVGGLLVLGGVWIYVRNRRRLDQPTHDDALEAEMVSAIETTIDDLRNERDARRAVIAAYAQMERILSKHGVGRHHAEAPLEYLARVLRALHVRDSAVRSLTELFEYAKFSRHEIDGAMKERAIDALLAVREDLQREETLAA